MSDILKSPGLGAILLGQLTFYLVNSTVMTHFLPHLADASWTPALSLFAFTIILVLNAPGKLFFGWLGDKVGPRSALGLAFLVQAAGLLLFVGASNPIAIWSAVALFGISWGAPSALVPALIISSLGLSRFGPASSAAGAAGLLGIAVGPYTAGVIYDRTGGYDFAWSAVSLIAAGVGVALLSWQSQKATPASDRASS